jgi:CHAP domain
MSQVTDKAVQIAVTQIGKEEHPIGSNWGDPVKSYLASVGLDFPASWCMAFIYWCFNQASKELNTVNPLVKTGGVLTAYGKAVSHHQTVPEVGDIFIMDLGGGNGHTGIVERLDGLYLYTIEGNTNDTGSREGYEVCRRRRLKTSIKGYLRY